MKWPRSLDGCQPVTSAVLWDLTEVDEPKNADEDVLSGNHPEEVVSWELDEETSPDDEVGGSADGGDPTRSKKEMRPPGYLTDYETFDD